jgi:hypothetical protein
MDECHEMTTSALTFDGEIRCLICHEVWPANIGPGLAPLIWMVCPGCWGIWEPDQRASSA